MTTATGAKTRPRIRVQELVNRFVRQGLDRPLSEDDPDIYYPDSDGNPMAETDAQFYPLTETVLALRQHYADRDDVYVSGDLLVYYRMNDNTVRLAPDVFVVFGVEDHLRSSYIIWREQGKTPDFVLEIASPSTFVRDMTEKRALYAALGVKEYWRFDPTGQLFSPALVGEQLADDGVRTHRDRHGPRPVSCADTARCWPWKCASVPTAICVSLIRKPAPGSATWRRRWRLAWLLRKPGMPPKSLWKQPKRPAMPPKPAPAPWRISSGSRAFYPMLNDVQTIGLMHR